MTGAHETAGEQDIEEFQHALPLGRTSEEDEAGHLRRVAGELGSAGSALLARMRDLLASPHMPERLRAAGRLGESGDRHAIAELRSMLQQEDPCMWEVAVFGLRQSRNRAGWLCLESVALDGLESLSAGGPPPPHAFRLLVMGRTKTMDRLFRAADGHSRSIPRDAAVNFVKIAVKSVPAKQSRVMALRLGIPAGPPRTPDAVAAELNVSVDEVRRLEASAWEAVQRPRSYEEITRHYGANSD